MNRVGVIHKVYKFFHTVYVIADFFFSQLFFQFLEVANGPIIYTNLSFD